MSDALPGLEQVVGCFVIAAVFVVLLLVAGAFVGGCYLGQQQPNQAEESWSAAK